MHYIFESTIVGMYSLIIYICFDFGMNPNIKLFMVGFIKHLLGYILNIHTYYCNNGYACLKYQKQIQSHKNNHSDISDSDSKKVAKTSIPALFIESAFEGCLFVFLNIFLLKLKIKNNYARIFILGVILHLVFEFLQLHIYFCKRCG